MLSTNDGVLTQGYLKVLYKKSNNSKIDKKGVIKIALKNLIEASNDLDYTYSTTPNIQIIYNYVELLNKTKIYILKNLSNEDKVILELKKIPEMEKIVFNNKLKLLLELLAKFFIINIWYTPHSDKSYNFYSEKSEYIESIVEKTKSITTICKNMIDILNNEE